MRFCTSCGAIIKDGESFCERCGKVVEIPKIINTSGQDNKVQYKEKEANIANSPATNYKNVEFVRTTDAIETHISYDNDNKSQYKKHRIQETLTVIKNNKKYVLYASIAVIVIILILAFTLKKNPKGDVGDIHLAETTDQILYNQSETYYGTEKSVTENTIAETKTQEKNTQKYTQEKKITAEKTIVDTIIFETEVSVEDTTQEVETKPEIKQGWIQEDGHYRYYDNNNIITGWLNDGGRRYFMDQNGNMVTGLAEISGSYYYFNDDGSMVTDWLQYGKGWYYFDSNGRMAVNRWVTVDGNSYYFGADGLMYADTETPDGEYVGPDGKKVEKRETDDGTHLNKTFKYDDEEEYYVDEDTDEIFYHYTVSLKLSDSGKYELKISDGKEKNTEKGTYSFDPEEEYIEFSGDLISEGYCDGDYIEAYVEGPGYIYLE